LTTSHSLASISAVLGGKFEGDSRRASVEIDDRVGGEQAAQPGLGYLAKISHQ
jgi:hypothetical protein